MLLKEDDDDDDDNSRVTLKRTGTAR